MVPRARARDVDPAVRRARDVVGLYGDPTATWGILVELRWSDRLDPAGLLSAAARLVGDHPHLGRRPSLVVVSTDRWAGLRARLASDPYGDRDPLVRLGATTDGRRLAVAAHHGAVDGLGLLAVAGYLSGRTFTLAARGIGTREAGRGFALSSAARLLEALRHPPARVAGRVADRAAADAALTPAAARQATEFLTSRTLRRLRLGSSELVLALSRAVTAWNSLAGVSSRHQVFALGASRRPGGTLAPDRCTAYVRLVVEPGADEGVVADLVRRSRPEPDFPQTRAGGLGPWAARRLRHRLGATGLVSNLGLVDATGLDEVMMYPAASGPGAVAVGCASTPASTVLTIRTRRQDFSEATSERFLDALVAEVRRLSDRDRGRADQ